MLTSTSGMEPALCQPATAVLLCTIWLIALSITVLMRITPSFQTSVLLPIFPVLHANTWMVRIFDILVIVTRYHLADSCGDKWFANSTLGFKVVSQCVSCPSHKHLKCMANPGEAFCVKKAFYNLKGSSTSTADLIEEIQANQSGNILKPCLVGNQASFEASCLVPVSMQPFSGTISYKNTWAPIAGAQGEACMHLRDRGWLDGRMVLTSRSRP